MSSRRKIVSPPLYHAMRWHSLLLPWQAMRSKNARGRIFTLGDRSASIIAGSYGARALIHDNISVVDPVKESSATVADPDPADKSMATKDSFSHFTEDPFTAMCT